MSQYSVILLSLYETIAVLIVYIKDFEKFYDDYEDRFIGLPLLEDIFDKKVVTEIVFGVLLSLIIALCLFFAIPMTGLVKMQI